MSLMPPQVTRKEKNSWHTRLNFLALAAGFHQTVYASSQFRAKFHKHKAILALPTCNSMPRCRHITPKQKTPCEHHHLLRRP